MIVDVGGMTDDRYASLTAKMLFSQMATHPGIKHQGQTSLIRQERVSLFGATCSAFSP